MFVLYVTAQSLNSLYLLSESEFLAVTFSRNLVHQLHQSRLALPGCRVSCWAGVAVRVVALDAVPRPARAAHALVVLAVRAELHRELARRLRVALRTPLALSNALTAAVLLTCAMCRQLPGTESQ